MPKLLHESTSGSLERKGNVWEAVGITPGTGSSGTYSEAMLAQFAAGAFPKGTKHWFNHPSEDKPDRDKRDQWGVSVEDASYRPGVGVVTKIRVLEHWRPVVESLAEAGEADLSVWVMGESDDNGNVTALHPDTQNAIDLVGYPGRPGSALTTKMFESARAASETQPPAASAEDQRKKENMEKWEQAIADISTKLDASLAESKAAVKAAEDAKIKAEADAQAALDSVTDKVREALESYKQKAEAIEAAELLPEQSEPLLEAAAEGKDITESLAEAVKVATAFKKLSEGNFTIAKGRVTESATSDLSIGAWN